MSDPSAHELQYYHPTFVLFCNPKEFLLRITKLGGRSSVTGLIPCPRRNVLDGIQQQLPNIGTSTPLQFPLHFIWRGTRKTRFTSSEHNSMEMCGRISEMTECKRSRALHEVTCQFLLGGRPQEEDKTTTVAPCWRSWAVMLPNFGNSTRTPFPPINLNLGRQSSFGCALGAPGSVHASFYADTVVSSLSDLRSAGKRQQKRPRSIDQSLKAYSTPAGPARRSYQTR